MNVYADGQMTASGKMRIDSIKGLIKEDGTSVIKPEDIANCELLFKDEAFSPDIEVNTSKQCCFHFESVTTAVITDKKDA